VSTGFTLNAFVGVFVTCTPVPMLTVVLTAVELAYPLLADCVCAFEVSAFVLPPPPQAATATNATRRDTSPPPLALFITILHLRTRHV